MYVRWWLSNRILTSFLGKVRAKFKITQSDNPQKALGFHKMGESWCTNSHISKMYWRDLEWKTIHLQILRLQMTWDYARQVNTRLERCPSYIQEVEDAINETRNRTKGVENLLDAYYGLVWSEPVRKIFIRPQARALDGMSRVLRYVGLRPTLPQAPNSLSWRDSEAKTVDVRSEATFHFCVVTPSRFTASTSRICLQVTMSLIRFDAMPLRMEQYLK